MKKTICFVCVILTMLGLLSACKFNTNMTDNTGKTKMDAWKQVEEMLRALAEADSDKVLALMHPDAHNQSTQAIDQLIDYMDGRKVTDLEQKNLRKTKSSGTYGTKQQESATLVVTMEDKEQFYLSVVYLTDEKQKGFTSFQLVLGMV